MLGSCGAEKFISPEGLLELLSQHAKCLVSILGDRKLVDAFDTEIKNALLDNPYFASNLMVRSFATDGENKSNIYLPGGLSNDDIDSVMIGCLNDERVSQNIAEIPFRWPASAKCPYRPSPEVRVLAKRVYDAAVEGLLKRGTGFSNGVGVVFDCRQIACKDVSRDRFALNCSFSGVWFGRHTDHATILNNCRYILDIVNQKGLMLMPPRPYEESGILAALGVRVLGWYRTNLVSNMREDLSFAEVAAYAGFLAERGVRIEDALEWAYNVYIASEYSIEGFTLALPSSGASWLDKCKAIGPEIERAVKAYSIYSKMGKIDGAYFPFESFKSFNEFKALKEKKYAISGTEFDSWAMYLFSDQCMLSYRRGCSDKACCFYDLMLSTTVLIDDYDEIYVGSIHRLIDVGLVSVCKETGVLTPTFRASCLKLIWDNGAFLLREFGDADLRIVDGLVSEGLLSYCNQLFTPDEANYLDYMFNDASFSNSQGLRNKYSHAHSPISDPNAKVIQFDYYRLLTLLVAITLKINDELSVVTGCGYIDDWEDWPYFDESVIKSANVKTVE